MDYLDCSIICNDITKFTELRTDILKYGIKPPMSESKGSIEWRDIHITDLEMYVNQINRNTHND